MSQKATPFARSDFSLFRHIPTRWMDVDIYGHVNNVNYLSFFDTAVNGWLIEEGALSPATSDTVFLVVETACQYFAEVNFPDTVHAGIRVARLGRSSVTYDIGLFRNEETSACAQGRFVHVQVEAASRRPVEISGRRRELLETIRFSGS
ncbi:acyl-CoA thioesterase [Rhizobiales bacterium]|uniref:acyl-CoA thioesterase n=1 Tax=Hongsoonwoonella zoysiae TaxID=2821844 RepID=UPI00155F74F4|nr:thioesterase family protein [Hongsoonwoonella zoysiae]NRG18459.1 acyl-CoA thioesterase [Hongsoonwoonella zoysiae]